VGTARQGINLFTLSVCQLFAAAAMLATALGVAGAPAPLLDATVVASIAILDLVRTWAAYVLNNQIMCRGSFNVT
jgi:hypothetical protein